MLVTDALYSVSKHLAKARCRVVALDTSSSSGIYGCQVIDVACLKA